WRGKLPACVGRAAPHAARVACVQPVAVVRRRRSALRAHDAERPRAVLRAVQLAGLPKDTARRAPRHGPGAALVQIVSAPTGSKPRRRYMFAPSSLGAGTEGSPVSVSIAAWVRAVP